MKKMKCACLYSHLGSTLSQFLCMSHMPPYLVHLNVIEHLINSTVILGTTESTMEPTCAARAMEWSIQLEKGLRSSKPGVPVKTILQMEPHLQRWSRELESSIASDAMFGLVPGEDRLFANAILLRLADAFRGGDKQIRLSVVRIFLFERKHYDNGKHKQCRGLLSKARVANQLELLKRVKSVFDGGDLESKALALILFGCWADFANDNAQIRYLILSGLVSPHECEVRASLFAAGCFCEISDDFAYITLEMLFNMMNSPAVLLPIKLAAAQVFAKFKCSYSVANKACKIGQGLILNSSNEDILVAMLFSLSKLASVSTLLTSNQVDFLLSLLKREITSHVEETTLRCLHFLFRNNPALKLYFSTSFEIPDGQTLEHLPSEYQAWKDDWRDDGIVELNKLFSDSEHNIIIALKMVHSIKIDLEKSYDRVCNIKVNMVASQGQGDCHLCTAKASDSGLAIGSEGSII
ncbi:Armadillo-type fold [Sesbania bispinosa]|nr:Armadillo-type fold [Sesbania bispinosa]